MHSTRWWKMKEQFLIIAPLRKIVIFRKVFANIYEISNRIENLKEIVIRRETGNRQSRSFNRREP